MLHSLSDSFVSASFRLPRQYDACFGRPAPARDSKKGFRDTAVVIG